MAHTPNMVNGTIEAKAASGNGDLDGYVFTCSECIEVAGFSFKQATVEHAISHANYMAKTGR